MHQASDTFPAILEHSNSSRSQSGDLTLGPLCLELPVVNPAIGLGEGSRRPHGLSTVKKEVKKATDKNKACPWTSQHTPRPGNF